jgi:hypothetical protein
MTTLAPIDVLEIRASIRAFLWWHWLMEIDEAVDELQEYAERTGLVAELGQDAVQSIIAAPFARLRALAARQEEEQAALDAAEAVRANPEKSDREIAADLGISPTTVGKARQDQVSTDGHVTDRDGRDGKSYPAKQAYRTPRSTIDAFWFVVRQGDATALAAWLAYHPLDKAQLHELWRAKCSTEVA